MTRGPRIEPLHRAAGALPTPCALIAALAVAGCTGLLGDADESGPGGPGGEDGDGVTVETDGATPLSFACDPDRAPSPSPMRRLSRQAYVNTLGALATTFLADQAPSVLEALVTPLLLVPADASDAYRSLDQTVSQDHVTGTYEVARAFAAAATADATRVERLAGACATDGDPGNDAACLADFVGRFGERAFRRPLTDAERAFYTAEVASPELAPVAVDNLRTVVAVMLLAPQFLYHVEDGAEADPATPDVFPLTGHEIASRLAYHFWATMPDEALLDAARSGRLATEEGFRAEVERVFADPRTTAAVDGFFAEWLRLDDVPPLDVAVGTPAHDAFSGDDRPGPELRGRMIEETLAVTRAARDASASFADLFLSDVSYATTDDLAAIYGVPVWAPGSDPVHFPEGQRAGVLTRAAMVATSLTTTRPIHKGVTIRRRVLCDTLGDPPADMGEAPEIDPLSTTRDKTDALTMQDGSSCAGCHASINPLGYASESFDALGRHRTHEVVYDPDGTELARLPVDTEVVPRVLSDDDTVARDAVELSRLIVDSGKPQACFARHYFRWAHGRVEDLEADGCVLEGIRSTARDRDSLREALLAVALAPSFRERVRAAD